MNSLVIFHVGLVRHGAFLQKGYNPYYIFWELPYWRSEVYKYNLILQATKNYEKAVQLNWNSPQVWFIFFLFYLKWSLIIIYFLNFLFPFVLSNSDLVLTCYRRLTTGGLLYKYVKTTYIVLLFFFSELLKIECCIVLVGWFNVNSLFFQF